MGAGGGQLGARGNGLINALPLRYLSLWHARERKRSLSVSRALFRRVRALALALTLNLPCGARAKDTFASGGFHMAHFGVRMEIT